MILHSLLSLVVVGVMPCVFPVGFLSSSPVLWQLPDGLSACQTTCLKRLFAHLCCDGLATCSVHIARSEYGWSCFRLACSGLSLDIIAAPCFGGLRGGGQLVR
ncbi:hypothetical protein ACP4OV_018090 [Aristida adscensionis]